MGNGLLKISTCFTGEITRRRDIPVTAPLDEGLGHSFCYVRPDPNRISSSEENITFRLISGASVSANTSTPLSTATMDRYTATIDRAAAFESSTSFTSMPLQPIPRNPKPSNWVPNRNSESGSVPLDRGFMSGPIERGFMSGPIDRNGSGDEFRRSLSYGGYGPCSIKKKSSLIRVLRKAISKTVSVSRGHNSIVALKDSDWVVGTTKKKTTKHLVLEDVQWAQGKAGEDRVHVVVSEEHDWVFVGIYDGFNGPDAPDYLLSNLYSAVVEELEGLPWGDGVLKALSQALKRTEEAYLEIADQMVAEIPELALMGSCVLVMLMKGEDVYVMNVGDSRAVLAQKPNIAHISHDLEKINEENEGSEDIISTLLALQLSIDHSTSVEEEIRRIRVEHLDDDCAVTNERVKGSLKVTRAFGAGFLKQPKWNNALLEIFRIDYVGNSPYITCFPSLCHHRLGPKDRFLILSSDGLYQYFTNEDAVSEVELFLEVSPDGDPAQHLAEELLFRAAKKYGLDFHELLEIPQGDRRRYHDDVSVIVISLEGRIWRSCV